MKHFFILFAFGVMLAACNQNDAKSPAALEEPRSTLAPSEASDPASFTTIQWLDPLHQDFGKINEGQVQEVTWRFKNSGNKPLIIVNASASCGCTVAEKPEQPIAPGEEGVIRAKFDSQGREGEQNKQVYVQANTNESQNHELSFRVEVIKK